VKELDLFLDGLTNDDTVVVVLSGHGVHFKGDKFGYFCPIDAKISTKTNLLPMDGDGGLYPRLEKCKAGRKLLVANACRNDPASSTSLAGGKFELVDDYPETVPQGIAAIFSCEVGQKSYFDPDRKRSLFMLHLAEAWKGGAGLEDVFNTTRTKTKADANKTFSEKQFPVVKRGYEGEWVIADGPFGGKDRKGGDEVEFEIADGVKMVFCWVPPGECALGSPKAEREAVMKQLVELKFAKEGEEVDWLKAEADTVRGNYKSEKGFWLAKYPVTQEQWTAVMKTTPFYFHAEGIGKDSVKGMETKGFPAEEVSWDDICGVDGKRDKTTFLGKVNARPGIANVFGKGTFRLPHEDEWEYACRGGKGNQQPFYWGKTLNGTESNCDGNYPYGTPTSGKFWARPTEVGSYAKKAPHPWGLCDMSGNVWQWCENLYSKDSRVLRGGSWDYVAGHCRAAYRFRTEPASRNNDYGFRVCFRLD